MLDQSLRPQRLGPRTTWCAPVEAGAKSVCATAAATSPPPVSPPSGRRWACFYQQERFRGAGLCASPGDSSNNLGAWDNRIQSIRINGGMTVQVCTDRNFINCAAYNRDQSSLPRWLRGNISAYRVFH